MPEIRKDQNSHAQRRFEPSFFEFRICFRFRIPGSDCKTPELPREGAKSARKLPFLKSLALFAHLSGDFCICIADFGLYQLVDVPV
jgi:hypothetical protein